VAMSRPASRLNIVSLAIDREMGFLVASMGRRAMETRRATRGRVMDSSEGARRRGRRSPFRVPARSTSRDRQFRRVVKPVQSCTGRPPSTKVMRESTGSNTQAVALGRHQVPCARVSLRPDRQGDLLLRRAFTPTTDPPLFEGSSWRESKRLPSPELLIAASYRSARQRTLQGSPASCRREPAGCRRSRRPTWRAASRDRTRSSRRAVTAHAVAS
jgi:hypothetical protein